MSRMIYDIFDLFLYICIFWIKSKLLLELEVLSTKYASVCVCCIPAWLPWDAGKHGRVRDPGGGWGEWAVFCMVVSFTNFLTPAGRTHKRATKLA